MHKEPQLSTLDELRGQLLLGWQRDAILPCRAEGSRGRRQASPGGVTRLGECLWEPRAGAAEGGRVSWALTSWWGPAHWRSQSLLRPSHTPLEPCGSRPVLAAEQAYSRDGPQERHVEREGRGLPVRQG